MKSLCILGSTGSIGESTLDVVRRFPDRFRVRSLTAGSNVKRLVEQAREFRPDRVALAEVAKEGELRDALRGERVEVWVGLEALEALAGEAGCDYVVSAIVGAAGLLPTLAAVKAGKQVGIANKEPLVMAGRLMKEAARFSGAVILPIDSEHSAIFQSIRAGDPSEVRKIVLTASGGPFRNASLAEMEEATVQSALNHPTWTMGAKITIDSATLMNKALEIVEAHFLFGLPYDRIQVWIHPQSIIHGLVEFQDGSVVAQMGLPDMRLPIQYALTYPERLDGRLPVLPLERMMKLEFEEPDRLRFPSLEFGYHAGRTGGTAPAVLNGANEEAVGLFLQGKVGLRGIFRMVERALGEHRSKAADGLSSILEADEWARERVRSWAS